MNALDPKFIEVVKRMDLNFSANEQANPLRWEVDGYQFSSEYKIEDNKGMNILFTVVCPDGREYAEAYLVPEGLALALSEDKFISIMLALSTIKLYEISLACGLIKAITPTPTL